jgi:hypothetical protein
MTKIYLCSCSKLESCPSPALGNADKDRCSSRNIFHSRTQSVDENSGKSGAVLRRRELEIDGWKTLVNLTRAPQGATTAATIYSCNMQHTTGAATAATTTKPNPANPPTTTHLHKTSPTCLPFVCTADQQQSIEQPSISIYSEYQSVLLNRISQPCAIKRSVS